MSIYGQVGGGLPSENKDTIDEEGVYDWNELIIDGAEILKAKLEGAIVVDSVPATRNKWKVEKILSQKDDSESEVRIGDVIEDFIPKGVALDEPLRMNSGRMITGDVLNIRQTKNGEYLVETNNTSIYELTEIPKRERFEGEIEFLKRWSRALPLFEGLDLDPRENTVSVKKIGAIIEADDGVDMQSKVRISEGVLLNFVYKLKDNLRFGAVEQDNHDVDITLTPKEIRQDINDENTYLVKTSRSYYEIKIGIYNKPQGDTVE
jgi:hypothetical protein